MTFVPKTYNELFEAMRGKSTAVTDFEVGSVARTMYESFSYEMALLYEKMQQVYLAGFVDTATGTQLDQVVAILGIKRGLPDFATGKVVFERDPGNDDILIPLGTLIATEETPESPKKVFRTSEELVLSANATRVEIEVQAVNRGENEATEAGTITVMPRPIPGVKAVTNEEPIRFVGKAGETDDALRERAKTILLSSGKASILAVENALLVMPGVKDVKVKENFHFAEGSMTFTRMAPNGDIDIPGNTRITADLSTVPARQVTYRTLNRAVLADGTASITLPIRATVEGEPGEIHDLALVSNWTITESENPTLGAEVAIGVADSIILQGFGVIEIYVDGPDLADPTVKASVQTEIKRVRAAGIFTLLRAVQQLPVEAIFRIEPAASLNLTPDERVEFENQIRDEITQLVRTMKMGETLSFAKLIKHVLSQEGVENLEDFTIALTRPDLPDPIHYSFADKRIELEEFERISIAPDLSYFCVASNEKPLPVGLEMQVQFPNPGDDDETKQGIIESTLTPALQSYFNGLAVGQQVSRNAIGAAIAGVTLTPNTLLMKPQSWCPRPMLIDTGSDELVRTSFVERPVLGTIFPYEAELELIGALNLSLPSTLTTAEKQEVRESVRARLSTAVDELPAESDVVLDDWVAIAAEVGNVLAVDWVEDDWRAQRDGTHLPERLDQGTISVRLFEKVRIPYVCITGDIETVEIAVDQLTASIVSPGATASDVTALEAAFTARSASYLGAASAGDNVDVALLAAALSNLGNGLVYTIDTLELSATSLCDTRAQAVGLVAGGEIHVRSVERAIFLPLDLSNVTIQIPA